MMFSCRATLGRYKIKINLKHNNLLLLRSPSYFIISNELFWRASFHNTSRQNKQLKKVSPPYRILFFGSDYFSLESLIALVDQQKSEGTSSFVKSIEVVVPPDRRTGRGLKTITQSPVKLFAQDNNLIIHEAPPKTLQTWKIPKPRDLEAIHFDIDSFDIGVVVSFGYFLPPVILESFTKGSMNVHPSLLPKYRGAAPIQHAILNGDQETGITIQELHHEIFDAGKILRQISMTIPSESTYQSLESILAAEGAELLIDTLRYLDYFQANAQEQDITKITKAPKISKDMAEIKWNQITADRLDKLYRAISHQYPITTNFIEKRIQLHNISLPSELKQQKIRNKIANIKVNYSPGTIIYDSKSLDSIYVTCNDDKLIECRSVKMERKNEISVKDWINGYGVESGKMKFESL
ncbi:Methionyl-tRNA formyltransferase [Gigaspora margarita]|uniref:Methionyl-tRNA formyltransferase, mitochondrial n=1 Tax=Gigaspora margarita TaxID=4874 RepID=A0A8H3X439_GIGMA|nr:Methionyl-tRNA formyltransferase [Gigaspora margarita]